MIARYSRTAILAGAVLALTACTEQAKEPVVATAPQTSEGPFIKLHPPTRAKRADRCQTAKVALPQDRKEALFRQFDAEQGGGAGAAVPVSAAAPAPGPDCRQAAR